MQKIKADNKYREKELINRLETGDKKLLLSSDTDHVQDRTGRTQEQINRKFYKRSCREFTADSTGKITVTNGEEGYVLSGEIKGQTVKNECYNADFSEGDSGFAFSNLTRKVKNGVLEVTSVSTGQPNFLGGNFGQKYSSGDKILLMAKIKCYQDCEALKLVLRDTTSNINLTCATENLPKAGQTYTLSGSTALNVASEFPRLQIVFVDNAKTGNVFDVSELVMINITNNEAIVDKVKGGLKFGLNSTQAVINNNGSLYPIYEPTIQGKTRILRSPKGANTWTEISESETRDTATYDYKLDSIGGNLGSTPSAYDYIDRARKVKFLNTKSIIVNGSGSWNAVSGGFYTNIITNGVSNSVCLSDNWSEKVSIGSNGNNIIFYTTLSKSQFLDALNENPSTIRYALATPQEIPLTEEEFKAYDEYKKVILMGKVDTVADIVQQLEDGSGVCTQSTKEIVLNGSENYLIIGGTTDTMCFSTTISQQGTTDPTVICNLFKYLNDSSDVEHCRLADNGASFRVWILKSKLTTQDVAGFKIWLASNNIIARYKLATPISTAIPKELMPTILCHDKINILNVDSPVAPSSFTVNVPTSDGVKKEFVLTLQNSWTGSLKALLLQNGRVRIVGAITAPSTFANIIANLPAELKPSVARKIVGLNGNTPIAIEIDTVPTVKCPTTVTGNIEINTEYEI